MFNFYECAVVIRPSEIGPFFMRMIKDNCLMFGKKPTLLALKESFRGWLLGQLILDMAVSEKYIVKDGLPEEILQIDCVLDASREGAEAFAYALNVIVRS